MLNTINSSGKSVYFNRPIGFATTHKTTGEECSKDRSVSVAKRDSFASSLKSKAETAKIQAGIEPISESVIARHTEYTDPETNGKVSVAIKYTTSYSEN